MGKGMKCIKNNVFEGHKCTIKHNPLSSILILFIQIQVMNKQEWENQFQESFHAQSHRPPLPSDQFQHHFHNFNPYETLHSANPILPPNKHKEKQQKYIRYKYDLQKGLNKTAFPVVNGRNWAKGTMMKEGQIREQEEEINKVHSQFDSVLQNKRIIYQRVNNEENNRIGINQTACFCSFFLNLKKQMKKAKGKPVFEFMSKVDDKYAPKNGSKDVVNFRSNFESGNLFCVVKNETQILPTYELYMQNDINTKGCTQWFYFCLQTQKRVKIKLRLMNFYKPTSLYMSGMKVLVSKNKKDWKRVGTAIKYNMVNLQEGRVSYAMQFIYEIQNPFESHYFSYGYPYQYSLLDNILTNVSQTKNKILLKTVLCQSFLGNNIYMLNISNKIYKKVNKPIIYIIGRQHPGETPASFILEGIIKTLLSNRAQMNELRDSFIIKIVPMVNVDGVINGNYRSNVSGSDVNRQWLFPSKKLHPEIYYLKEDIINHKKQIRFFLDVHAHSRKMNSFFYGSRPYDPENRFYPFICSKLSKFVSYKDSSFCNDPSKRTTARVVVENQLSLKKSLTFEVSFYGWEDETKRTKHHFNIQNLENIGESLALGLYYSQIGIKKWCYKNGKEIQINRNSASCKLDEKNKLKELLEVDMKIEKNCVKLYEKWKKQLEKIKNQGDEEVVSEGSSLDPEHFQLKQEEEVLLWEDKMDDDKYYDEKQNEVLVLESRNKTTEKVEKSKKTEEKIQEVSSPTNESNYFDKERKSFYPTESNLKNSLVVKKLEHELQINRNKNRRYLSIEPQNETNQQAEEKVLHKSIEVKDPLSYRRNISEMKNALKYFISKSSKETDYDNYREYVKNGARDTSVVFRSKEKSSIKKKYIKI